MDNFNSNDNEGVTSEGNNVVSLPVRAPAPAAHDEQIVLVCTECQCKSFWMHEDGRVECTNCESFITMDNMPDWRRVTPALTDEERAALKPDLGCVTQNLLGDRVVARTRVLKLIDKWAKEDMLAMVVAYDLSGAGKHWMDVSDGTQKQWMLDKLASVAEFVEGMRFEDEQDSEIEEAQEDDAPPEEGS